LFETEQNIELQTKSLSNNMGLELCVCVWWWW